jgi:outer membrane protein OmpA-like peptidoglycan-associated protein
MRIAPIFLAATLVLTGCAGTKVSMYDGEVGADGKQNPTGAIAAINEATGEDIAVIDQAYSRSGVGKRRISAKAMKAEKLNARYGALLATMPQPPKLFILYFKPNSTDLVADSELLVPAMLDEVKNRPGVDVQIVGHTDTMGGDINDSLSRKRAEEVRDVLATKGLDGRIVETIGRGERQPIDHPGVDEYPSELNRRVEVLIK